MKAAWDRHARLCAAEIGNIGFDVLYSGSCLQCAAGPIAHFFNGPSAIFLGEPNRLLAEARPTPPWMTSGPSASRGVRRVKEIISEEAAVHASRLKLRYEYENAKAFRRILVNSQFSRESVLRQYGLEAKVCYPGIDGAKFHPHENGKKGAPFIVGLGAFNFNKGIERAIEAVSRIPEVDRPKLIWIGNDSHGAEERNYIAHAAERGVIFEAKIRIADEELVRLLSAATALIYTSRLEPFGLAPLEAAACGTPTIAIAEGGIRETVRHGVTGFLVPDDDPNALAAYIVQLLHDPILRSEMGERARQMVLSDWTWGRSIDRLEQQLHATIAMFPGV
jgi:glycosyltransferase involved in cell wall biosynthesis